MSEPAAPAFSASDAALEGFRVVRERWRLVVGWGVFNLVAFFGLIVLAGILIVAAVAAASSREAAGVGGAVIGGVLLGLGAFAIEVMIVTALFRVELRKDPPGFLHLRIGPAELRVAAVWLLIFAAVFGAGLVSLFVAGLAGDAGGPWAGVPVFLLLMAAVAWLALRLSLAAPIAVAEGRLGIAASWRLTRGRVLPLLGMSLLAFCLLVLVAVSGWLLLAVLSGAASGFQEFGPLSLSDPEAFSRRPGFYIVQLAAQFLFAPVLWAISQAPLAAAYKAFR